jgi:hypothetical protein
VAADAAAAEVDDELDADLADLRSELAAEDDDVFVDAAPAGDEVVTIAEVVELERTESADGTVTEEVTGVVVVGSAVVSEVDDDEPSAAQDAAEELAAAPEQHDGPTVDAEGGATVHDLFARIRAEGLDDDAEAGELAGEHGAVATAIDLTDAADEDGAAGDLSATTSAAAAPVDAGDLLFDRRDDLLLPVEKSLARALKRLASDEQNEILDRLRRVKRGRPDPVEVLPSADAAPFVDALAPEFARAVGAGVEFWSELSASPAAAPAEDDPRTREVLESRVEQFLALHRAHLERAFAEADEADLDTSELGDRVRATYRDWRSGSLADLAGDLATAGFTLGERHAAGTGTPWRWVVDHGGLPCADGEDNALAGDVACGEPFPTGDVTPPAHPGCRCILAPAHR